MAAFYHVCFAVPDRGSARLAVAGMPVDFSGCPYGRSFAYHRLDSIGARVELVDAARRPAFLATWHPDGQPMAAIDEDAHG